MEAKFNLWIEQDGQVVLSTWRVRLLEVVQASGSISAAAEQLNVPYRRAWEKIQQIERGMGVKVLVTAVGGPGGGGAHLTEAGRKAVAQFRAFAEGFDEEVADKYAAVFHA